MDGEAQTVVLLRPPADLSGRRVTAAEIRRALQIYFHPGEWHLCWEVGNGTGSNARRHADAVAMNLWPSRGLAIHGVEIKVSRSDWKRELSQPEKAEEVHKHCDYWWVATAPGVVSANEIPDGWGQMEYVSSGAREGRMRVLRHPARQPRTENINRGFVAALLKANARYSGDELRREVDKRSAEIIERTREQWLKQRDDDVGNARARVAKIEAAVGRNWAWANDESIVQAIAIVLKHNLTGPYNAFSAAHSSLVAARNSIDRAIESSAAACDAAGAKAADYPQ